MGLVALSIFADKASPPTAADVKRVLGRSAEEWQRVIAFVRERAVVSEEWGFTAKSTGWGLRVKSGDRVVLYLTPCEGHFLLSFVLGDRAVDAVLRTVVPDTIREAILSAKKYAEGRGVRFAIHAGDDLTFVHSLVAAKLGAQDATRA